MPLPDGPDQRHELARLGVEADVGQREGLDRGRHGAALGLRLRRLGRDLELGGRHRVAERDVVEADPAAHRARRQVDRVGRIGDLVVHLEVLEDAVEQRQRALDLDLDVEQLAEREEEARLERGEGHDGADADVRVAADDERARRAGRRRPA